MSIAKNQSEFLKSKLVNSLGSLDYGQGIENAIQQVLFNASKIWSDQMQKNLDDFRTSKGYGKKTGSDVLRNSIHSNIEEYSDTVSLKLYIEDYYINVNDGRKGTKQSWRDNANFMIGKRKSKAKLPPYKAIKNWLGSKPLKLRLDSKGKLSDKLKKESAINAIRFGIKRTGVEPTYFYSQVINDQSIKDLTSQILKSTGKALIVDIKRYK